MYRVAVAFLTVVLIHVFKKALNASVSSQEFKNVFSFKEIPLHNPSIHLLRDSSFLHVCWYYSIHTKNQLLRDL